MKKQMMSKKNGMRNESVFFAVTVVVLVLLFPVGCQQPSRVYKISDGAPNAYQPSYQLAPAYGGTQRPNNQFGNGQIMQASLQNGMTTTEIVPITREYHLGPGDILKVKVNQLLDPEREETLLVEVDRRGQIYLPLLNHIQAGGLTCEQLRNELVVKLGQEFIRNPQVDIKIERFGSKPVTVLGSVRNPGTVNLEADQAPLMDVISLAGGITGVASDNVEILRYNVRSGQNSNIMQAGGVDSSYVQRELVPLSHLYAEDGRHVNPIIYPGDVVKIPNSENGYIYLAGAVTVPGAKPFYQPMTILQAVSCAGGPKNIADEKKCKIIRRQADGSENVIMVNLEKVRKGKETNITVSRNDTIMLAVDPGKKFLDDLTRLFRGGVNMGVDATYDAGYEMGMPNRYGPYN